MSWVSDTFDFHTIFHDVLGTVHSDHGKLTYDWTKIDKLYDDLRARQIRPFVELALLPRRWPPLTTASFTGRATPRTLRCPVRGYLSFWHMRRRMV